MNEAPVLSVENLTAGFSTDDGYARVIEDVSFTISAGSTLGIVGESGSGKSVAAQTIMRILPSPPARLEKGRLLFEGIDMAVLPEPAMRKLRGDRLAMVFQEPMTSLNPTMTVGAQISEALELHRPIGRTEASGKVLEMLRQVGIGAPERRAAQYPHQLSGGLRQRVMIAMALICGPKLLIADEPTTALDVTVQAQILTLLSNLQQHLGLAMLLITHDLNIIAEMSRDVVVMYAGRIVESGPTADVLGQPRHPYTAGLLASSPRRARKGERLAAIPGVVPPPGRRHQGCSFADRCMRVQGRCHIDVPPLEALGSHREAACWNPLP
jgi:peptide/nickel transport system ATP-binding protein/oligopeptide transport system ATP-binding protein